jgi:hypothetical protein
MGTAWSYFYYDHDSNQEIAEIPDRVDTLINEYLDKKSREYKAEEKEFIKKQRQLICDTMINIGDVKEPNKATQKYKVPNIKTFPGYDTLDLFAQIYRVDKILCFRVETPLYTGYMFDFGQYQPMSKSEITKNGIRTQLKTLKDSQKKISNEIASLERKLGLCT